MVFNDVWQSLFIIQVCQALPPAASGPAGPGPDYPNESNQTSTAAAILTALKGCGLFYAEARWWDRYRLGAVRVSH